MNKHGTFIAARSAAMRRPFMRHAALAACALALVACQTTDKEITGSVSDDYRQRHPITLEQSARTVDIPVGMHSESLTPASRSAISGFARDFKSDNAAMIQVMVPSGARNEINAGYVARDVRVELMRNGVNSNRIDVISYAAPTAADAPIRLAYPRMAAKTLPCGTHPAGLTGSKGNLSHFDFGCSSQQNLAVAVANPQDLIQPRGWDARDAQRRSETFENYRKGTKTWSEELGSKSGSSSEVGQ